MKNILIITILLPLLIISSELYPRISSQTLEHSELKVGDSIGSPLGFFKLTLQQEKCQLTIYQFNSTAKAYQKTSAINNNQNGNCLSIKISPEKLVTDTGFQIAKLSSSDFSKTWLVIDDNGKVKLIGIKKPSTSSKIPQYQEQIIKSINNDQLLYKNIYTGTKINFTDFQTNYRNQNDWIFDISKNQLKISKGSNPSLNKEFSLQDITLDASGIYDKNKNSPPFAVFNSALIYPRCDLKKKACQFKAPYTIQFNKKWPIARIYDQQQYLIAQYSLSQNNNFERARVCPTGLFLLQGLCIDDCPEPYFEKIQGYFGQCVLSCQQGSIIDSQNKRCSCSSSDLYSNNYDTKKIKNCQREWKSNFYGCNCTSVNQSYDRQNTLTCQSVCPLRTITHQGICLSCPQNCQTCSKDTQFVAFLKCDQCQSGYQLERGRCIKLNNGCLNNCQSCNGSTCLKCSAFYALYNGSCLTSCPANFIVQNQQGKGSFCIQKKDSQLQPSCFVGCSRCQNNICLSCATGYVLFVSPLGSTCKLKTSGFSCNGQFVYEKQRQICYIQNPDQFKMAKCKSSILHCQTCQFNSETNCILCQRGFFLHKNKCVERCPTGYLGQNNICEQQIKDCQSQGYITHQQQGKVNLDIIKNSQVYKKQIADGLEPANNFQGNLIYMKQFVLEQDSKNQTLDTISRSTSKICLKCKRGYGLSNDGTKCISCPQSCQYQHCFYARQNSCYKPTIKCTFLDENNNCMESCPEGRYPQIDKNNETRCLPESLASVKDYLKIDSSFYNQQDGSKIYYFVLDKPVENGTIKSLSARLLTAHKNIDNRLLIQSQDVTVLEKGQYYEVRNTNENAVAIAFDQNVNKFRTPFGFTLANSVYGAQADYTHNQWMKQWLAHIGFILSWVILVVHCIYIGNTILYKVDNLIIFCQTIFFFTFVKLLVGNTLAQYYYGWSWMHMGFWPNYFKSTVPSQYQQKEAPLSFKLATLDGNMIRNAGFAISLFLTFLVLWIFVCLVVFILYKVFHKFDIWYTRIVKNTLLAAVELLSMVVFYFSVTQLLYGDKYPDTSQGFHTTNVVFSIIFICLISVYMIVRFFFNKIGGLYMFKRLCIALIIVDAYQNKGFVALLVGFEVVFSAIIYFLERPRLLREKLFLIFQLVGFIISYFLLFFVTVPGVNVLIITTIIFIILLLLIGDLIDLYLQSRNQYYDLNILGPKYDNQEKHEDNLPDSERKMNI